MATEKFRLPSSSYAEFVKIVKAYGQFDAPASLDDVSKMVGLGSTVISGNAGFLVGVGILESGSKKSPTAIGKTLARSLEHDMPDEIRRCWREVVFDSDFLSKLLTAIRIRNGMDVSTLESHIAYSAGQPKKKHIMTGARTVIDILRAAELVIESDGKVTVAASATSGLSENTEGNIILSGPNIASLPESNMVEKSSVPTMSSNVMVNIELKVQCAPDELEGVGLKIRQIIADIASSVKNKNDSTES